jgi:predicted negative regulator of RcsB-dependent stress response
LRSLLDMSGNAELKQVARLRLARVMMYQDKPAEVLDLLADKSDTAFLARYSEASGDAYVALGRFDEAAEAYAVAISEDPNKATVDRTLVQMKLNDLPEPGEVVAIDESLRAPVENPDDATGTANDESEQ